MKNRRAVAAAGLLGVLLSAAGAADARVEERLPESLSSGTRIELRLLRPEHATTELPAIVLLGGVERGAGALDLLPDDENVVLASFDYPVQIPRRIGWRQLLPLAAAIEQGIADTREALGLLYQRLRAHEAVDGQRISVIGASFGAPFALHAVADSPYAAAVLVHGFADVPKTVRHQFSRRWREDYGLPGELLAYGAERLLNVLIDYPDPRDAIRRLRGGLQVLVISASQDEFVPPAVTRDLIDALTASAAELTHMPTPGRHVRGNRPELLRELFSLGEPWLRERQLL